MAGDPGAGPAARIARLFDCPADIFVLVVEAGRDLVEIVVFWPAFGEIRPRFKLLSRRPAVAAAGQFAEAIETHVLCFEPELEAANFAGVGSVLRLRRRGRDDEGKRGRTGRYGSNRQPQTRCLISSSARTGAYRCPRNPRNLRRSTRRVPRP